jgi:hypothetical protein
MTPDLVAVSRTRTAPRFPAREVVPPALNPVGTGQSMGS